MQDWLTDITTWLVGLIKEVIGFVGDLVRDVVVWVLDAVLGALGALIASIPSPSFMSEGKGLGDVLSGLPDFALYVISNAQLPAALAIVASGVAFNLARKVFTLGQW